MMASSGRGAEANRDGDRYRRDGVGAGFWVQADHCRSPDSIARAAAAVGVTPPQYRVLLRQIAGAEKEAFPDPDLRRLMEMGFAPDEPAPLAPLSSRHLFDDVRLWAYRRHGRYSDQTRWTADVTDYAVDRFEQARGNVDADLDLARAQAIGENCANWTWTHLHRERHR